jgi:hypothetical protein
MRLRFLLVLLTACSTTAPKAPTPPANTADATAPAPAPPVVTLAVGRMSFVMDSPEGQRDKAEAAVRSSDLAAQLVALGYRVAVVFDETAGDHVIATTGDAELGRVELFELWRGRSGESIIAAARQQLRPRR